MFDPFENLTVDELRSRGGSKWVTFPDAIGTFVAESDFGTAPSVLRAVQSRVDNLDFGYTTVGRKADLAESTSRLLSGRYNWPVDPSRVGVLPEVLSSLEVTLEHFSPPGTPVIVPTPTYMPFFRLLRDHGREIIEVPLLQQNSTWTFDHEAIEDAFARGAGLLILVNPGNPTGTVHTRDELTALVDIVERHGGRVWADEVHAPLIYDGRTHVPYASLSDAAASHTVTATSASKGWNIPGLTCSQTIFNEQDSATWAKVGTWTGHAVGHLGVEATIAAYDDGTEWLDALVAHLQHHRDLLTGLVTEHLPDAGFTPPQGTYLDWLDLRAYGVRGSIQNHLHSRAGVAGTDGRRCGHDFRGWYRINHATPAAVLTDTVERIGRALDEPRR
ncbi:MAG: MalY/PatB family protein [Mycobacteriaceae bacterium]